MELQSAEFICSNTKVSELPPAKFPEYAFVGRSNVGKSSLINALTRRKGLAKTSQKPGKTQLINHFVINKDWYLVDLPGYGFAKVSQKDRASWKRLVRKYLMERENLQCVMVLVDVRHKPQKLDLDFCHWLGEQGLPFYVVFTKADKVSSKIAKIHVGLFEQELLKWFEEMPKYFVTSAQNRLGCVELLQEIDRINREFDYHSAQEIINQRNQDIEDQE